jgi:multiple sugar transport system substrate-binding protein
MQHQPSTARRTAVRTTTVLAIAGALSVTAACSGSGSGSGGGEAGSVTWSTWGTPEELTHFQEFNAKFMDEHPDIKVTFQPVPSYDEYHTKLLTQLSSGTAPDVFYIGDDRVASVVPNGVLMPLDDKLSAEGSAISKDDFTEDVYSIAELDGSLYALPNDVNPDTWWYNKAVLEAAGITEDPAELAANDQWTTQKFLEMSDKIKAADLSTLAFWNYWATHDTWMVSQGGEVYDDSGAYVANTDQASVAAMEEFSQRVQDEQFLVADILPEGSGSDTLFLTDKLGFYAQGRYTISALESAGVDMDQFDIVRWPTPDGAPSATGLAASFLAINAKAADADAAYTFFSEFLSAEGQEIRLAAGNAVPSIKGADDLVLESGYPAHAQTMLDMRDLGFTNYVTEASVPNLSGTISNDFILPMYQGKMPVQETLDAIAAKVDEEAAGR